MAKPPSLGTFKSNSDVLFGGQAGRRCQQEGGLQENAEEALPPEFGIVGTERGKVQQSTQGGF